MEGRINCEPIVLFSSGIIFIVVGFLCDTPLFFVIGFVIIAVLLNLNVADWVSHKRLVTQKKHRVIISSVEEVDIETICTICQDSIKRGNKGKRLACQHIFHCNCIDKWLEEKNTCPNCRYVSVQHV